MRSPEEKYRNDTHYRMLVDALEGMIHQAQFTPSEIREAAIYAAIRYEMTQSPPPIVMRAKDIDEAVLGRLRRSILDKCPGRKAER